MHQRYNVWQELYSCSTVHLLFVMILLSTMLLPGVNTAQAARFAIGLIGDLPYSPEDEAKFPKLMQAMNQANLAFVVHIGDIEWSPRGYQAGKPGSPPCTDQMFAERKRLFQTSRHPFILLPGDNDWTDCHGTPSLTDPIERLHKLREVFYPNNRSLGQRTRPLTRQSADPRYAKFPENVRWSHGEILFATVHIVGSNNNRGHTPAGDIEYAERNAANLAWLKQSFALAKRNAYKGMMILTHANPYFEDRWSPIRRQSLHIVPPETTEASGYDDFLDSLTAEVIAFDKPVALVHGDTHYFRVDKPLSDTAKRRLIEDFTRVEVFGSPYIHWVRAIVDPDNPQVFTFIPEIVPQNRVDHRSRKTADDASRNGQ